MWRLPAMTELWAGWAGPNVGRSGWKGMPRTRPDATPQGVHGAKDLRCPGETNPECPPAEPEGPAGLLTGGSEPVRRAQMAHFAGGSGDFRMNRNLSPHLRIPAPSSPCYTALRS